MRMVEFVGPSQFAGWELDDNYRRLAPKSKARQDSADWLRHA
jgi:hypothetical protein